MKKLLYSACVAGSISLTSFLLSPWFPNTPIQTDFYIVGGVCAGIVGLYTFAAYIEILWKTIN